MLKEIPIDVQADRQCWHQMPSTREKHNAQATI